MVSWWHAIPKTLQQYLCAYWIYGMLIFFSIKRESSTATYHHTLTLGGEENNQQQHLKREHRKLYFSDTGPEYSVTIWCADVFFAILTSGGQRNSQRQTARTEQIYFMWYIKCKRIKAVKLALCFYFQMRWWGHCIMSLNMCAIWKAICVTSTDRMTGLIDSIWNIQYAISYWLWFKWQLLRLIQERDW